ncbi:MAG: DUF4401 domain-containing protein [Caldilineaceae bacterium]|nr:DUF4401 domain-containing protein [Caldilineaceae bacterium]
MEAESQGGARAVSGVLAQLVAEGLLDAHELATATTWMDQQRTESPTPWYIKAFVGISAWLAAIFIIAFLGMVGLIDSGVSMVLLGIIFGVAALALKWMAMDSIFGGQLAFAVSLAGQGLLIAGASMLTENMTATALVALGLEALLFVAYPDTMHRLISVVAMAAALVVLLLEQELPDGIHMIIALFAVLAIYLWRNEVYLRSSRKLAAYWSAAAYGTLLVLAGLCVLPLIGQPDTTKWWISTAALGLGLLYLGDQILRELEISRQSGPALWLLAGVGLLLIPTYQTPGILAALIGLLLAFWRSNNLQMGLSSAFLLFFIGVYYYNLDFTLLEKSYILLGTGAALLVIRLGLLRWGRREGT